MVSLPSRRRNTYYFILLAGLLAIIWALYAAFNNQMPERSLSDLLAAVDGNHVTSATFTTDGDRVDWVDADGHQYRTLIPGGYVANIIDKLHQNQRPIDVVQSSSPDLLLSLVLPNALLILVIGSFAWYMLRQMRQKAA